MSGSKRTVSTLICRKRRFNVYRLERVIYGRPNDGKRFLHVSRKGAIATCSNVSVYLKSVQVYFVD